MRERTFYVYIMTNKSRTLYTGVTNDLYRRVTEHKEKLLPGFTSKYNINKLVHFEEFPDAISGIEREKQIKGWLRSKKIALIEETNPNWDDLSLEWMTDQTSIQNN
jgi:putative endonuclease